MIMSKLSKKPYRKLVREITIILIIKVVILLIIKHIWFDAPTIPKNFDHQVAERITGTSSATEHKESLP